VAEGAGNELMKLRMPERFYQWSMRHIKALGLFLIGWTLFGFAWLRHELFKIGGDMKKKQGIADIALVCLVAVVAMAFTAICGGKGGFHYRTSEVALTNSASNTVTSSTTMDGGGSLPIGK